MRFIAISILLLFIGYVPARAKIQTKEIKYSANGVTLKGYLAYDNSIKGKRPGVLVVHEL